MFSRQSTPSSSAHSRKKRQINCTHTTPIHRDRTQYSPRVGTHTRRAGHAGSGACAHGWARAHDRRRATTHVQRGPTPKAGRREATGCDTVRQPRCMHGPVQVQAPHERGPGAGWTRTLHTQGQSPFLQTSVPAPKGSHAPTPSYKTPPQAPAPPTTTCATSHTEWCSAVRTRNFSHMTFSAV